MLMFFVIGLMVSILCLMLTVIFFGDEGETFGVISIIGIIVFFALICINVLYCLSEPSSREIFIEKNIEKISELKQRQKSSRKFDVNDVVKFKNSVDMIVVDVKPFEYIIRDYSPEPFEHNYHIDIVENVHVKYFDSNNKLNEGYFKEDDLTLIKKGE